MHAVFSCDFHAHGVGQSVNKYMRGTPHGVRDQNTHPNVNKINKRLKGDHTPR